MFNEFLLGMYNQIWNDQISFWILFLCLTLLIAELFFINNTIENRKSISKKRANEFPVIVRKHFPNDISFVLACKCGYVFLSSMIAGIIFGVSYLLCTLVYYMNGTWFIVLAGILLYMAANYIIYKLMKKEKK